MTRKRRIGAARAAIAAGLIFGAFVSASDIEGKVVAVHDRTVTVRLPADATCEVGDRVAVMQAFERQEFMTSLGNWRVIRIQDSVITAEFVSGSRQVPKAGMIAYVSPDPAGRRAVGPSVPVPGGDSSGAKGKVTEVRGRDVTIRLDNNVKAAVGDRVELSYLAGTDRIGIGKWRVSKVLGSGRLEAAPVEPEADPQPGFEALVWAIGLRESPPLPVPSNALFEEGLRLFNGRGVPVDKARAVQLWEQAARQGHAEAAEQAGFAYENGNGVPQDDAKAAQYYRQGAEAGLPTSQNNYGAFLSAGRGVPQDEAAAVSWYLKAAEQGEVYAQTNLCKRYAKGDGVQKNEAEALRLCRLAAAKEHPTAIDQLGHMYQHGIGVTKDERQAYQYYRQAAELGHANGQNNLGHFLEHGIGVPKDLKQAFHWYEQAAAQGHAHAEFNLGEMYLAGEVVPRHEYTAAQHFKRAAKGGHEGAKRKLKELGAK